MPLSRGILLLSFLLAALGALISPAWLPSTVFLGYGFVILGAIAFVNSAHIVSSWHIFYRNPVLRERLGRRLLFEHVLLPLIYIPAFITLVVKIYPYFPGVSILLFLLIFDGPIFAHHVASQDRGLFSLYSSKTKKRGSMPLSRFFFPILFLLFAVIFSKSLLQEQTAMRSLSEALHFDSLFIICCIAGAIFSGAGAVALWRAGSTWIEIIYLTSIAVWFLANLLIVFKTGLPLVLLLIHSMRHAGIYVILVGRYFAGNELAMEPSRRFWLPMLMSTVPVSILVFYVYLGMPGFWPGLFQAWAPTFLPDVYPYFIGLLGALLLHHYHIERYSWRFSEAKLGEHLKARIL